MRLIGAFGHTESLSLAFNNIRSSLSRVVCGRFHNPRSSSFTAAPERSEPKISPNRFSNLLPGPNGCH
jgi:hypothetical protein